MSLETNNSLLISPFTCYDSLWCHVAPYIATSCILCNGVYMDMHIYEPSLIPRPAGLGMKLAMWHIPSVHGKAHSGGWFQTWSRHVCAGPMNANQPTWNRTHALSSLAPRPHLLTTNQLGTLSQISSGIIKQHLKQVATHPLKKNADTPLEMQFFYSHCKKSGM